MGIRDSATFSAFIRSVSYRKSFFFKHLDSHVKDKKLSNQGDFEDDFLCFILVVLISEKMEYQSYYRVEKSVVLVLILIKKLLPSKFMACQFFQSKSAVSYATT